MQNNPSQNIAAIILAGGRDFGRCPLASSIPPAAWPVLGTQAWQRVIKLLEKQEISTSIVCDGPNADILRNSHPDFGSAKVSFIDEILPLGTAGCLREALKITNAQTFLILHAAIISLPNLQKLITNHKNNNSILTAYFEASQFGTKNFRKVAAYLCDREIEKHIPKHGFCDIKEGLIPHLLREGHKIHSAVIHSRIGSFNNHLSYISELSAYLSNGFDKEQLDNLNKYQGKVYAADNVDIDESARLFGPLILLQNVRIGPETVIIGPSVIGKNVTIAGNCLIQNSIIWDDVSIDDYSTVTKSVLAHHTHVPRKEMIYNRTLTNQFSKSLALKKSKINIFQL